jgi:hypothetical protein
MPRLKFYTTKGFVKLVPARSSVPVINVIKLVFLRADVPGIKLEYLSKVSL